MKYRVLLLAPVLLLIAAPTVRAHDLVTVGGSTQHHQHVYRRQEYGEPLQQGHLYQNSAGSSMISWRSGTRSTYGEVNGRRDGPIIDDHLRRPGEMTTDKKKFGAEVREYGKPRPGYGTR